MDLARLIAELSDPAAYPQAVATVDVRQTHISVVLLVGDVVYKVRKPVKLPFVDFSTLELRRQDCEAEVRLNARLAAEVYLGVVPIVERDGRLCVEGAGEPIEWAVKMRRLAEEDTLASRLERQCVSGEQIAGLARLVADFHATADRGPKIASFGRWEVVAANARGNFSESQAHVGTTVARSVFERVESLTEAKLQRLRDTIEARAARGVPCDTHGDLRADHVYFLGGDGETSRTVIIDCLEFNDAFRYADPVADIAFLAMDLTFAGRRDLAQVLTDTYFEAADDDEGRRLMPFYVAYRAAVRAKVEGLKQAETEVLEAERAAARERARGYWLLALGALESAAKRPALVLVAGLPGSGKSTLAAQLAERAGFEVIRSDVVRKELAGADETATTGSTFGAGMYTPDWNERTYAECLARAEASLREGGRVIVDASFREDARRQQFLELAARHCTPAVLLVCEAPAETVRQRLEARRGDASDADWEIYQSASRVWEPASPAVAASQHRLHSGGTRQETLEQAVAILRDRGLLAEDVL